MGSGSTGVLCFSLLRLPLAAFDRGRHEEPTDSAKRHLRRIDLGARRSRPLR